MEKDCGNRQSSLVVGVYSLEVAERGEEVIRNDWAKFSSFASGVQGSRLSYSGYSVHIC